MDVDAGDEIWFRVRASDGKEAQDAGSQKDEVDWRPVLTYTDLPEGKEPYGAQTQTFSLEQDGRVAARAAPNWISTTAGEVRVEGVLEKETTADDLRLVIYKRSPDGQPLNQWEALLRADDEGTIASPFAAIEVAPGEQLVFEVQSDVTFDPQRLRWLPKIVHTQYTRVDPETSDPVRGAVLCGESGCFLDDDPLDEPLPDDAAARYAVAAFDTKHYLPYEPRVSFPSQQDPVVASIDVSGADDDSLARTVLVLQSEHRLIAKARPDEDGVLELSYQLDAAVDEGPFFLTLVGPASVQEHLAIGETSVSLNERWLDPGFHEPDSMRDPFSGGYHRFRVGDFNGSKFIADEPIRLPKGDPLEEDAPYFMGQSIRGLDKEGEVVEAWAFRSSAKLDKTRFKPAIAGAELDEQDDPEGNGGIGDIRRGVSRNVDFGVQANAGAKEASLNYNQGRSLPLLDLIDLNGDGLPDSVRRDGVRYNHGRGRGFGPVQGLELGFPEDRDFIRLTRNYNVSKGAGVRIPDQRMMNETDVRGSTSKVITTTVGGGVTFGESNGVIEMLDINGDGLVDQLRRDNSANIQVRYGLGYRFTRPIVWETGEWSRDDGVLPELFELAMRQVTWMPGNSGLKVLRKSDTWVLNASGGVEKVLPPGAKAQVGVSGGAGMAYTTNRTYVDMIDVNGDALPDAVMKRPHEDALRVRLNMGTHFANEQRWSIPKWPASALLAERFTTMGSPDVLSFTRDRSFNLSLGTNVRTPFGVVIGGNMFRSQGTTVSAMRMQDIDGDGLVDHVLKSKLSDKVYVKRNQLGRSNLLTRVKRPFGSAIELEYRRRGNEVSTDGRVDMSRSRFVLAGVRVHESKSDDDYIQYLDYHGGKFDRSERSFFGFEGVTMTREADGSREESDFYNQDFYRQGQLEQSRSYAADAGAEAKPFAKETHDVEGPGALPVREGVFFPSYREVTVEKIESESDGASGNASESEMKLVGGRVSSRTRVEFDARGDVVKQIVSGDLADSSDDLLYKVQYHRPSSRPWISLPKDVQARTQDDSELLRHHTSEYNKQDKIKRFSVWVRGGLDDEDASTDAQFAETIYEYYEDLGLLSSVTSANQLKTEYKYLQSFQSQPTAVRLPGGLTYLATYEPTTGRVKTSTDPNGHVTTRWYDQVGRLVGIDLPETYKRLNEAEGEGSNEDKDSTLIADLRFLYSAEDGRESGFGPDQAWAKTLRQDQLSLRNDPS